MVSILRRRSIQVIAIVQLLQYLLQCQKQQIIPVIHAIPIQVVVTHNTKECLFEYLNAE
jgi:hypothetical protein